MKPLSVYIHIPFCVRKCAYCDFASWAGQEDRFEDYFRVLGEEIDSRADTLRDYEARSVFFGGGTPSHVPVRYIRFVLEKLRSCMSFAEDAEITLEVNPGTVDEDAFRQYRDMGINRISLGVQSFDAELLKFLGRIHTAEEAERAIREAVEAGITNVSLDLMYALPGQSMAQWKDTLERAVRLPVSHISCYSLIIEEGTVMKQRLDEGKIQEADEDLVNEMQRFATAFLREHGFDRYEISNYAKPGFESRHNRNYWECGEYMGFGAAAHSYRDGKRFSNPASLSRYLEGIREEDTEILTREEKMEERIMLETRTVRGLDLEKWERDFGFDFTEKKAETTRKLEAMGLIFFRDGCLCLTESGMELQDSVVLELL